MLIREVILENFMSYEYARVPLKPNVNIICGPNGSGKSSLLLAISVALGQSYTERSKKLSDLIRWGKDQARITLILDNAKKGGRRPIPKFNKDSITLTRVLRRDGEYWFELDNKAVTKHDVERLLTKLGVDTNNMLIIMHQNMIEQLVTLSPQDKLRMVEAAVGLQPYRENVLQAQRKLTYVLSQKESVDKLLESAEQTLNYWREQYDRYQERKRLLTKRMFLERELAWAEVSCIEGDIQELEANKRRELEVLSEIVKEIESEDGLSRTLQDRLYELKGKLKGVFSELLKLEREKAISELTASLCEQLLNEVVTLRNLSPQLSQLMANHPLTHFKLLRDENLVELVQGSNQRLLKLNADIRENQARMKDLENEVDAVNDQVLNSRIRLALLRYHKENVEMNVKKLEGELEGARSRLSVVMKRAEDVGPRVAVTKGLNEILDEIRVVDGHLAILSDVSEDAERMYESYSALYFKLKERAGLVAENMGKVLGEIEGRMQAWRTVIQNLLDRVNLEYQGILAKVDAVGKVKLINGHDIEAAGLEILIGFKGGKPVQLNAYTQSGGERGTALMGFLLALQKHIKSPFRAVDEFDLHLDARNREVIANLIVSSVNEGDQFLIITPGQLTFDVEGVSVIVVQNVEGSSVVKVLERA